MPTARETQEGRRWDRLHHDLLHIERAIVSLNESITNLTTAVDDARTEIQALAQTIRDTGDVEAAAQQLDALAANLEQAVSDAQATDAPPAPDAPPQPDPGPQPPTDAPPATP